MSDDADLAEPLPGDLRRRGQPEARTVRMTKHASTAHFVTRAADVGTGLIKPA